MAEAREDKALDALVLAGTGGAYVPVGRRAKALIHLHGRRLVEYVVDALEACPLIRGITVIGPPKRLGFLKEGAGRSKPLEVIPQQGNIVRNVLAGYDHIRPAHDAPILVATSDIPLLSPGEVEYFISHSECEGYDYVMGLASERALEPYYPSGRKRGIRMSYMYFSQFAARINNLHIMNPSAVAHPEYGGILYSLRYQKRLGNFFRMVWEVLARKDIPSMELIKWGSMLELAVQLDRFGWYKAAHRVGGGIDIHTVEHVIARTLGIRFKTFCMDFGAAALDIDNRRDLVTMRRRFGEWKELTGEREAPGRA